MKLLTVIFICLFFSSGFSQVVEIKKAIGISNFESIAAVEYESGSVIVSGSNDLVKVNNGVFTFMECPLIETLDYKTIALAKDADNKLWVTADNSKVGVFDGINWEILADEDDELPTFTAITFDKRNDAWAVGDNKLYKYTGNSWVHNPSYKVDGIVKDMAWQEDTLWLAVNNAGFVKFFGDSTRIFSIFESDGQNAELSLAIDKDGKKWLSSSLYGVACFNDVNNESQWVGYSQSEYSFLHELTRIYIDNEGVIWTTSKNKGVSFFDGTDWLNKQVDDGLFSNAYNAIVDDEKGNIWLCSNTGLSSFNSQKITNYLSDANLAGDYFATHFFDSKNRMWISTYDGTTIIDSLNSVNQLDEVIKSTYFTVFKEDHSGNIWAGTLEGLWKNEAGIWTLFTTDNGLAHNTINDIAIDGENNVWCATLGGVSKFQDGLWINYSESDGIPLTDISYIVIDNQTNVWISSFGTENSVSVFNGQYWNTINTDLADSIYILAMELDLDNTLWLGTTRGLFRYGGSDWAGFLNEDAAGSNISSITVDPNNNLLILNEGKQVVRYNGEVVSAINAFEDFPGKIVFDNQGYMWGINGHELRRASVANSYLKLLDRYRVVKDYNFEFTFQIIANAGWEIDCEAYWLQFSETSGDGSAIVSVRASEDLYEEERVADIKISGTDVYTQTLTVIQKGNAAVTSQRVDEIEGYELATKNEAIEIIGKDFSYCEMYNIKGVKVLHSCNRQNNTNDYDSGIYLIRIFNSSGEFETKKLLIAHHNY